MQKRTKKQKSILQNQENKQCYLCMLLYGDDSMKQVEDHHIFYGTAGRRISEWNGFKVNLCIWHHRIGKEAVHLNRENDLILKRKCQEEYEKTHTRQEFYELMHESFLGGGFEHA